MSSAVILQFALAIFQLRETGSSNMDPEGRFRAHVCRSVKITTAWLRGQTRIVLSLREMMPVRSGARR